MRFLCLHGAGTNSSILRSQLHALTQKLDPSNEYIYLDGEEEVDKARGLPSSVGGPYLAYYKEYTSEQLTKAIELITIVVEEDGPFDAVLGFSQGATLILSYLIQHEIDYPDTAPPIRFALLFSPFLAVSSDARLHDGILADFGSKHRKILEDSMSSSSVDISSYATIDKTARDWRLKHLLNSVLSTLRVGVEYNFISTKDHMSLLKGDVQTLPRMLVPCLIKERITIPVVHVLGAKDSPLFKEGSDLMKGLCTSNLLYSLTHRGGHDVPKGLEVAEIVRGIEWAMNK